MNRSRRSPAWGTGLAACVVLAVIAWIGASSRETAAQRPAPAEGGGAAGLWISCAPLDAGRQLLLVIDPHLKNAAVYHVDTAAGTLALKSSRDISYDLMVGDFNAQAPKPSDLKKLLETAPPRR